jgi:hypothetical protein
MEQNPSWEADSRSDSQEVARLLWNPKTHYCVYKESINGPYPEPDESSAQLPDLFRKIHSNNILPSNPTTDFSLFSLLYAVIAQSVNNGLRAGRLGF